MKEKEQTRNHLTRKSKNNRSYLGKHRSVKSVIFYSVSTSMEN